MVDVIREILIPEKELADTNYERLKKGLSYTENKLIDSNGNMYLTVDSLIERNSKTTGSNHRLIKVNLKPYGFDKMYLEKDLIEDKLYQIMDHFNERKIVNVKLYSMFLNKIHLFTSKQNT